jgi:transposase
METDTLSDVFAESVKARIDPMTRALRMLGKDRYSLREAAEILGISSRTLRKLKDDYEHLGPSYAAKVGKNHMWVYTSADIAKIREHLEEQAKLVPAGTVPKGRGGRPPKWTPEQRAERQRLFSQRHYWTKRAQDLRNLERFAEADEADIKAAEIRRKMVSDGLVSS